MMEGNQKNQHVMPRRANGWDGVQASCLVGDGWSYRPQQVEDGVPGLVAARALAHHVRRRAALLVRHGWVRPQGHELPHRLHLHHQPASQTDPQPVSTCKRAGQRGPPPPALWRVGSSRAGSML